MKPALIISLFLVIVRGTAKNHTTKDFSRVLVPTNNEEEEAAEKEGEVANNKNVRHEVSVHKENQPEASDGDTDSLKLHNSLQSLRDYLEMLSRNRSQKETPSIEETVEDNKFGPHYHTVNTNEPPMETDSQELPNTENVGDNPPKDLYFQPIPISDKIAVRKIKVGTEGEKQTTKTILLAVSSAILATLLLLFILFTTAMHCYRKYSATSLTSFESKTRMEDRNLLWDENLWSQSSSEAKHARKHPFSHDPDELSTLSDESARTCEREKTKAAAHGMAERQAASPPPAKAVTSSVLPPAMGGTPAPASPVAVSACVLPPATGGSPAQASPVAVSTSVLPPTTGEPPAPASPEAVSASMLPPTTGGSPAQASPEAVSTSALPPSTEGSLAPASPEAVSASVLPPSTEGTPAQASPEAVSASVLPPSTEGTPAQASPEAVSASALPPTTEGTPTPASSAVVNTSQPTIEGTMTSVEEMASAASTA